MSKDSLQAYKLWFGGTDFKRLQKKCDYFCKREHAKRELDLNTGFKTR